MMGVCRARLVAVVGAAAMLLAASVHGCGDAAARAPRPGPPPAPPPELCDVEGDEDGDGKRDCDDPDCWVEGGSCRERCDGGEDEDGDGAVDCDDSDCWVRGGTCAELCTGGEDEDGDGAVDCDDADCWVQGGTCAELCTGGEDEDGDGAVDCDDADCWVQGGTCAELCTGGHDEDADGAVDCADPDCELDVACAPGFARDVQPLMFKYCSPCHRDDTSPGPVGDFSVDHYEDMLKPSYYCKGQTKGWCSLFRINEPTMPSDCFNCVPLVDVAVIQKWVDAGTPP